MQGVRRRALLQRRQELRRQLRRFLLAYVQAVQDVRMPEDFDRDSVTLNDVEASMVRCPDPETAEKMIERIDVLPAPDLPIKSTFCSMAAKLRARRCREGVAGAAGSGEQGAGTTPLPSLLA